MSRLVAWGVTTRIGQDKKENIYVRIGCSIPEQGVLNQDRVFYIRIGSGQGMYSFSKNSANFVPSKQKLNKLTDSGAYDQIA